jgi:hypothetical protein
MPIPRIPLRMNLLLLLLAMRLWLVELVAVPLAMAWLHPAYGLLLLAALLLIPLRWQLLHEAAHGRLLPTRRYNRLAGRLLAISLGLPFDVWRQAHQLHHRYSRTAQCRVEVYEPGVELRDSCCCACACVAGPICWPGRVACCCVTRLPPAGTGWHGGFRCGHVCVAACRPAVNCNWRGWMPCWPVCLPVCPCWCTASTTGCCGWPAGCARC